MRILHVTDCYLPRLGGIEMHVSDLATRQHAAGHTVTVVTREAAGDAVANGAVPVERLRCGPLALGGGDAVRRLVETLDVDVVHAHLSVASPLAWAALRSVQVATVATVHSVVPDAPETLRAAMALTGFPSRTAVLTAVSEIAAAPWRRAVPAHTPVGVLHNGIDPAAWATPSRPRDDSVFTIVSVGRLARRKRQRPLVGVLADVRRRLPDGVALRAVLVGDGPQLRVLRGDIARSGLADVVELPGALTRPDIREILAGADVYVAPATLESFGIAALEARCAGVPVVAMSRGGAGEFVRDGREGFLVADDAALADALVALASDRALRDGIAHHNATTVPSMAWPAVLLQHDEVYALASARARRPVRARRTPSVLRPT